MSTADSEDQAWRPIFARLLLCVMMLFYLFVLARMALRRPVHHSVQAIAPLAALFLTACYAAVALTRLRVSSLVALVVASLLSLWMIYETVFHTQLLNGVLSGPAYWRTDLLAINLLAIYSLPVIALIVVCPLKVPPDASPAERAALTQDS